MQLLARLMDHALAEAGRRATIVGATSGDTVARRSRPSGIRSGPMCSCCSRMAAFRRPAPDDDHATEAHLHAVTIPGTFDDCQNLVKALFNNHRFRDSVNLAGVISINWARVEWRRSPILRGGVALGAPHRRWRSASRRQFSVIFSPAMCPEDGVADRAAGDRHQRERHSGANAATGRYEMAPVAPQLAVDGYPDLLEFRAPSV